MSWDEEAGSDIGYQVYYYCAICEDFFKLSPIAPLRCPYCYTDARNIIGPIPAQVYDVNDFIQKERNKQIKKYGPKLSR